MSDTINLTRVKNGIKSFVLATASAIGAIQTYSGSANKIPKSNGASVLSDSSISDNGTEVSTPELIRSLVALAVQAVGSNTVLAGANLALVDNSPIPSNGWVIQLGAGGELSFWAYSGTWQKRAEFSSAGAFSINGTPRISGSGAFSGSTFTSGILIGSGNRPLITTAAGLIDDQDAATFRGTIGTLPIADPAFTGTLSGPSISVTNTVRSGDADSFTAGFVVSGDGFGTKGFGIESDGILRSRLEISGASVTVLNSWNASGIFIDAIFQCGNVASDPFKINRPLTISPLAGSGSRNLRTDASGNVSARDGVQASSSASLNLGDIAALVLNLTGTGQIVTVSNGNPGDGWDIWGEATYTIRVPSGVTLYAYSGLWTNTDLVIGGGRSLRIVSLNSTTWLMPNYG
jgi:hypothetical protein